MIDTIRLKYVFRDNEYNETLEYLIENFAHKYEYKTIVSLKNGGVKEDNAAFVFNTDYLNIYINEGSISVKTSLWKLFHGNNVVNFDKDQIIQSIDILQNMIPTVDWNQSYFNILHVGPSLNVKYDPDLYINLITGKEKLVWISKDGNGNSKSIGSKKNYTILYNKSKESKAFTTDNVIRIEYRIEASYWFEKYFGSKRPELSLLLNNLDYVYYLWYKQYQKLEKDYLRTVKHIDSIQDLFDLAIGEYGHENCKRIILDSFKLGKLNVNKKDYAMRRINSMMKKTSNDLSKDCYATELDEAVTNFMISSVPNFIDNNKL